jgi:hypothetical protein
MINWYYILIIAVPALAFILWKEIQRRNKKRLWIRLSTSFIAFTGLLTLSYPLKEQEKNAATCKIVLLTDGFIKDSISNLLPGKNASFFTTTLSIAKSFADKKIQFIADLKKFASEHKNDTIHVFGNGFEKEELNSLNEIAFIFHAPQALPTITSVNWKQQLKPGEPLVLQGKYSNKSAREIKICLQGFGEIFDSIKIAGNTETNFSLQTTPKHTGRAVYSLLTITGNDTLQNEPIPLNIESTSILKILLLSSSPDFEKTFLKNKLSQNGYEITASTVISKNKKNEQFINMRSTAADLFNLSNLEKFDAVITDDEAISQLNGSQSASLRSAIEDKGTGLVVKISNEKNISSFYSRYFPAFSLQQDKRPFILLRSAIDDSNYYKLRIEEPVCLRYQNGAQALLKDDKENIYASNIVFGQGRIVATTLNNTYTLALSGDNPSWQSLWALLLSKASRKKIPDEDCRITPGLALINEPTALITQNNLNTAQAVIGESKIYLQKDSLLSYQSKGIYWPTQKGWQSLIQTNGKIQNWYTFDRNDWKSLRDFQEINDNKKYVSLHPAEFIQQSAGQSGNWTSHLKLYLVILFFICCSILWVEQKLG